MHPLRRTVLTALAATAISAGCVTINIYFPAAAVEKAADRIIDEIYQARKDAPASVPSPAPVAPATRSGETK